MEFQKRNITQNCWMFEEVVIGMTAPGFHPSLVNDEN